MATKKNARQVTANKRSGWRLSQSDKSQTLPAKAPPEVELVTAADMKTTAVPMPEPRQRVTPMLAAAEYTLATPAPQQSMPSKQAEKSVKLSALEAVVKVLSETDQAMSCAELVAAMAAQG